MRKYLMAIVAAAYLLGWSIAGYAQSSDDWQLNELQHSMEINRSMLDMDRGAAASLGGSQGEQMDQRAIEQYQQNMGRDVDQLNDVLRNR